MGLFLKVFLAFLASFGPRFKGGEEKGVGVLCLCEGFPNVPFIGTRGCINYNPMLVVRQLGYPMRSAPSEDYN